ncbi:MAG: hypothetical protein ACOH10_10390 [Rhodoglobus sp.]
MSPAVLKNRGVPMTVHTVVLNDDGQATDVRALDSANEYAMEPAPRYIRFDNNILSDIEDTDLGWGSVDAWEEALIASPFKTVRATLALCWGFDPKSRDDLRVVGAICPDATEEVGTLIGAAYMLANGMDPQLVGEAIRQSEIELAVVATKTRVRMAEALAEATKVAAQEATKAAAALLTLPSEPTPTATEPPGGDDTHGTTGSADGSSSDETSTSSGL